MITVIITIIIIYPLLSICPLLQDPLALFEQLDADGGGELSLQERHASRA